MKIAGLLLLALAYSCGSNARPDAVGERGGDAGVASDSAGGPIGVDGGLGGAADRAGAPDFEAGFGGSAAGGDASGGQVGAADAGADAGASACDPNLPLAPEAAPYVHGLALSRLAFFQAVSVPLMEQLVEVTDRRAAVVTGRPGLLRVFVDPAADWRPRAVRARLTLSDSDVVNPKFFDQTQMITGASTNAALPSTFNFEVSADALSEKSEYSVELFEAEPCVGASTAEMGARFPAQGRLLLGAQPASKLRIVVVPVESDQGSAVLLPDTSTEQIEHFRSELVSLFPVTGADISVRAQPLHTTASNLSDVLDQVDALRDAENTDPTVSYYGVVRFTDAITQYCNPSCVLGASFTGTTPTGGTGVGIGYTGDKAALTFAHELGHVYGRPHTPCGVAGDPGYPYANGEIGSWGYDVASKTLFDPITYSDFMGYCSPVWVSDFTYEHLREFIAAIPQPAATDVVQTAAATAEPNAERVRALLLERGQPPRWGLSRPARGLRRGLNELATTYDASGTALGSITVQRALVSDLDTEIVYVPEPGPSKWVSVRVNGQTRTRYPEHAVLRHLGQH